MPDFDEHWKRIGVFAVIASIIGVTVGISPWVAPDRLLAHNFGWPPVLSGSLFVLASIVEYRQMAKARGRARLRALALSGDADVVPLAALDIGPARARDVAEGSLTLLWQQSGKHIGVVADVQGLIQHRADGTHLTLPWSEAHLWEVTDKSGKERWTWAFTLYGASARISWPVYGAGVRGYELVGFGHNEIAARVTAFSDLVAARTGLPLRTFSPRFMSPRSHEYKEHETRLAWIWRAVAIAVAFALATLSVYLFQTATAQTIPLLCLVGAFGICALSLVGLTLYSVAAARRLRLRASHLPYALPILVAMPEMPVVFAHDFPLWRRIVTLSAGVLFLPTYAIYALALPDMSLALTPVVGFLAFGETLLGIGCLALASRMSASTITADEDGLTSRDRKDVTHLAWDEIASVEADQTARLVHFAASSADERTVIFWNLERGSRRQLPEGMTRVTAEELAAIVVQHSGKPLTRASAG